MKTQKMTQQKNPEPCKMVASGDTFVADKLLQHSGCQVLFHAAGCKKGGSPESTQHKAIVGLPAAKMARPRMMNMTCRWDLHANPHRRLETFVGSQTLLVAPALKNVTRIAVFPSAPTSLTAACERAEGVAGWNMSVEYTMIPARISTRRPINSPAAL